MSEIERLGKIEKVWFGIGGYQGACIGLNVTLGGDGWGTGDSKAAWDKNLIKCSDRFQWTEEDRSKQYDEIVRYVSDLLASAKVDSVEKLRGKPIAAKFEGNMLKSWRILTEVI